MSSQSPIWSWIELSGADASDFFHRLTPLDVRSLQVGQGGRTYFLNAQGKILSTFLLWKTGPTQFFAELEDPSRTGKGLKTFLELVSHYHFSEKLQWVDRTAEFVLSQSLEVSPGPAPYAVSLDSGGSYQLTLDSRELAGSVWRQTWTRVASPDVALQMEAPVADPEWILLQRQALRPWVEPQVCEANPLELGLRWTLSEQKGCYPGQEVIEKTLALGAPARRLVLLEDSRLVLVSKVKAVPGIAIDGVGVVKIVSSYHENK